jgi:hypothetical protein
MELFHERGNCIVHLYAKGQSQRGPSIRIPLDAIYNARFEFIFGTFFAEMFVGQSSGSRLLAGAARPSRSTLCDLYIPTPDHVSRAEALSWHLTTRNFFAFLMDKPLAGSSLSAALLDLQERLDLIRPNDPNNHSDLMSYFERSGYLDFSHCPDYALAFLHFAERSELYDLWVDAFVHCVGMNEMLTLSPEFNVSGHNMASKTVADVLTENFARHQSTNHSSISRNGLASGKGDPSIEQFPRRGFLAGTLGLEQRTTCPFGSISIVSAHLLCGKIWLLAPSSRLAILKVPVQIHVL